MPPTCQRSGVTSTQSRLSSASCAARKQAVLRAITLPNVVPGAEDVVHAFITQEIGVYQNKTLRRYICSAMTKHRGRCVDAFGAFNGPEGTQNAYAKGWL